MKKRVTKELAVFAILFIVVAFFVHQEKWLSDPIGHLAALMDHTLPLHPLLYTFFLYVLLLILRLSARGIGRFLAKKR